MILNGLERRLGAFGGLWKPPQAFTLMRDLCKMLKDPVRQCGPLSLAIANI